MLRVGESDVTTLSVEMFNSGEDAHDTTLTVTLPDTDVDYLGTDSHASDFLYFFSFFPPNSISAEAPPQTP